MADHLLVFTLSGDREEPPSHILSDPMGATCHQGISGQPSAQRLGQTPDSVLKLVDICPHPRLRAMEELDESPEERIVHPRLVLSHIGHRVAVEVKGRISMRERTLEASAPRDSEELPTHKLNAHPHPFFIFALWEARALGRGSLTINTVVLKEGSL